MEGVKQNNLFISRKGSCVYCSWDHPTRSHFFTGLCPPSAPFSLGHNQIQKSFKKIPGQQ